MGLALRSIGLLALLCWQLPSAHAQARRFPPPRPPILQVANVTARYKGTNFDVLKAVTVDLAPSLPLAPVHLVAERLPGSDDVRLSWVRRSRADPDNWALEDAPADFVPEAYRLRILDGEIVQAEFFLQFVELGFLRFVQANPDEALVVEKDVSLAAVSPPFVSSVLLVDDVAVVVSVLVVRLFPRKKCNGLPGKK